MVAADRFRPALCVSSGVIVDVHSLRRQCTEGYDGCAPQRRTLSLRDLGVVLAIVHVHCACMLLYHIPGRMGGGLAPLNLLFPAYKLVS